MNDLTGFNPNAVANPNNNIFGLPFTEEESKVIILPVPWEVTVSYGAGTARAAEHVFKSSMQVDLLDMDGNAGWKQGFFMKEIDKKLLLKSDYLRKEAELYIDYISQGAELLKNKFMCKSVKEINEGSNYLNNWVYEQSKAILDKQKIVGLLGGDHSTPLGLMKALAEKHGSFGVLQIDAHCDLRIKYEDFTYSHASIMYNALNEIPELTKLVQVGVRDYCEQEWEYICNSNFRVITYFDKNIKERLFEGHLWKNITEEIIQHLPQKVYISFDIDGLDRKLCPNTGTPVPGGFESEEMIYLFKKIKESGRELIGFDLVEIGVGETDWDSNVGARILWRLCNLMV
ncbi:MAG TPA: agmatinase family protein [Sediminibacterium sp.]|jgi:agmatinase|uniref:agmatinase family protein n=1 Tax=Sediminibacterium sp. TaxID=1917865 RepID=UPI0008B09549|nr:agmatinase family protein [Sediminibacterium sp.]OHC85069.1 MAG: agmatinase [Sphingobacteriia bacterium RIFOXYC2_FULL_35_18]OHC87119.1 MAG: agmatinase [Sphingobacteriia bacterium RIFOXYD2_FULL_35_12]OYY11429.1 MAG: agmatinase [Sphingobacteriia bacterium 35-36-14]OYZ55521.1 MAG: agmatinase [Sphingobacteriia bacterium 24-36-13]OZA66023.1 MAG: agmatinase [Sphingobacteriia bacterium 39-36-14]